MKTLNELQPLIIEWANNKGLVNLENAPSQRIKLVEECGELAGSFLKKDVAKQKDAIGDIFVVLVILQAQYSEEYDFELNDVSSTNDMYDSLVGLMNNASDSEGVYLCFYWLLELSICLNHDIVECANLAWNEIKDRTGTTVNGTFIKN